MNAAIYPKFWPSICAPKSQKAQFDLVRESGKANEAKSNGVCFGFRVRIRSK